MHREDMLDAMRDKYAHLITNLPWDYEHAGWLIGKHGEENVWVVPMLMTFAIFIGPPDSLEYRDQWCYSSFIGAVWAASAWVRNPHHAEPTGWHRHPASGRRRTMGDPSTEYVSY